MARKTSNVPATIALTHEARDSLKAITALLATRVFQSTRKTPTYSDAIIEAERIIRDAATQGKTDE